MRGIHVEPRQLCALEVEARRGPGIRQSPASDAGKSWPRARKVSFRCQRLAAVTKATGEGRLLHAELGASVWPQAIDACPGFSLRARGAQALRTEMS